MNKSNGSGNGHDEEEDKVLKFPSLAERDRQRKQKEKEWREQYRAEKKANAVPFINMDKIPPFAGTMVAVFFLVHIPVYLLLDDATRLQAIYTLGFVPGAFTGSFPFHWYHIFTPLTHMIIHGSWMHLLFNSVMGLVLGMYVEKKFGTRRATIFFLLCGLAGAALFFVFNPFSTTPVIGASGGISGFFGAVLILLYQQRQLGAISMSKRGPWPIIGFWVLFMVVIGLISGGGLAWQAHVGGFLAGALLLRGLQKGLIRF